MLATLLLGLLTLPACDDESDVDRIRSACTDLCSKAAACVELGEDQAIDCVEFCKKEELVQELSENLEHAPKQCVDSAVRQFECFAALECSAFLDENDDSCLEEAALTEKYCEDLDLDTDGREAEELRETDYYIACNAECEKLESCALENPSMSVPPYVYNCEQDCLEEAEDAMYLLAGGPVYQQCVEKEIELLECLTTQSCDELLDEFYSDECSAIDDEADAACEPVNW